MTEEKQVHWRGGERRSDGMTYVSEVGPSGHKHCQITT